MLNPNVDPSDQYLFAVWRISTKQFCRLVVDQCAMFSALNSTQMFPGRKRSETQTRMEISALELQVKSASGAML